MDVGAGEMGRECSLKEDGGRRLGQVEPRTDIGVARRVVAHRVVAHRGVAHRGVARRDRARLSFVQRLQCILRAESMACETGSSREG